MNEWNFLSYVLVEVKLHDVEVPLGLKIYDLTSVGLGWLTSPENVALAFVRTK